MFKTPVVLVALAASLGTGSLDAGSLGSGAVRAQTADPVWSFGERQEEFYNKGYLSFAVPETDIMPLTLSCQQNSGELGASRTDGPPGLTEITLAAGGVSAAYRGISHETEIPEMPHFISSTFRTTDPVMQAFAETGRLRMTVAGDTYDMRSDEAGRGAIQAFFAYCGRPYGAG